MSLSGTRQQLETILGTIPSLRVVLGVDDQDKSEEFFEDIVTAGPLVVITPAKYTGLENFMKTTSFDVKLKLYFGYANNADYDYLTLEDLWESILNAVCTPDNYDSTTASCPIDAKPWEDIEELLQTPRVVFSEMVLNFKGKV